MTYSTLFTSVYITLGYQKVGGSTFLNNNNNATQNCVDIIIDWLKGDKHNTT